MNRHFPRSEPDLPSIGIEWRLVLKLPGPGMSTQDLFSIGWAGSDRQVRPSDIEGLVPVVQSATTPSKRGRGRPRLEDGKSGQWRLIAERALVMLRDDPDMSLRDIADRLGMVPYSPADTPEQRKTASMSAAKKLGRWMKRLQALGDQGE